CTLGPVRGVEIPGDAAELPQVACFHIGVVSLFEQPEASFGGIDIKVVKVQSRLAQGKFSAENFVRPLVLLQKQGDTLCAATAGGIEEAGSLGCPDGGRNVDMQGTCLVRYQSSKGGFKDGLLAVV